MSDLVGNPEDRFSHNEAQMSRVVGKPDFGVYDKVKHKQPTQLLKLARDLKLNRLYYLGIK